MGVLLVALSAASFGTMPIFAVWAYEDGASTWALLTVRFGLAGLLLAAVLVVRRIPPPPLRRCLPLAAMGAGYVGQSACYFTALHYAQASLVSLLLYLFPAFVAVLAALFLGERVSATVAMAIAMSVAGTALLVGGGSGRALGIALGVGAALIYSVYITVGTVVTAGVHPLAVTTVVSTSAAVMSGLVALTQATGGHAPSFPESAAGWGALVAISLVCTVVSIMAFFAGLQRLGATQTALLSTMEPVLTIALATWLLNETMTALQLCGGLIVLISVMWQALGRRPAREEQDERGFALEGATTPPV